MIPCRGHGSIPWLFYFGIVTMGSFAALKNKARSTKRVHIKSSALRLIIKHLKTANCVPTFAKLYLPEGLTQEDLDKIQALARNPALTDSGRQRQLKTILTNADGIHSWALDLDKGDT